MLGQAAEHRHSAGGAACHPAQRGGALASHPPQWPLCSTPTARPANYTPAAPVPAPRNVGCQVGMGAARTGVNDAHPDLPEGRRGALQRVARCVHARHLGSSSKHPSPNPAVVIRAARGWPPGVPASHQLHEAESQAPHIPWFVSRRAHAPARSLWWCPMPPALRSAAGTIRWQRRMGRWAWLWGSKPGRAPPAPQLAGRGGGHEMFANKTRRCRCFRCGRPSGASIPSNGYLRRLSGPRGGPLGHVARAMSKFGWEARKPRSALLRNPSNVETGMKRAEPCSAHIMVPPPPPPPGSGGGIAAAAQAPLVHQQCAVRPLKLRQKL